MQIIVATEAPILEDIGPSINNQIEEVTAVETTVPPFRNSINVIEELPIDNIVVNNEGLQGTSGDPRG